MSLKPSLALKPGGVSRSLTSRPFRVVVTGIWGHGAQGKLPYSSEGECFATKAIWLFAVARLSCCNAGDHPIDGWGSIATPSRPGALLTILDSCRAKQSLPCWRFDRRTSQLIQASFMLRRNKTDEARYHARPASACRRKLNIRSTMKSVREEEGNSKAT